MALIQLLDFGSSFGEFQISEAVGSDAFAYKLFQETGRYAKDKTIGGDDVPLTFWNGKYEAANDPRVNPISGELIYELTHGFEELLATRNSLANNMGFEAYTRFKSIEDGDEWVNGEIDYSKSKTDEATYFSCNIVQETECAKLERNGDTIVNVLGSVDLNGDAVAPVAITPLLLKAFPIDVVSDWTTPNPMDFLTATIEEMTSVFNPAISLGKYEVSDSYTPFDILTQGLNSLVISDADEISNFRYLFAKERVENLTINLTNINFQAILRRINTTKNATQTVGLYIRYGNSFLEIDSTTKELFTHTQSVGIFDTPTIDKTYTNTNDYTFVIPVIEKNQSVYIYFTAIDGREAVVPTEFLLSSYHATMSIEIGGTQIGIDSVIDAVAYDKFLAKGIEMVANLPLNAPDIQTGLFKNQFVFTGKSIKQDLSVLNFVWNDERNDLQEVNLDYLITEQSVEIAKHQDFYPNVDLGMLGGDAWNDVEKTFSDRPELITFDFGYESYEKSELAKGTNQSFHTQAQFKFANGRVQNKKVVKIKKIRDPLMIEKQRRDIIKQTTALDTDDKISIVDGIELPPAFQQTYNINLLQTIDPLTGNILLFNKINSDDELGNFTWDTQGIAVGSTFYATILGTRHTTKVIAIQPNIITLQQVSFPISTFIGNTLTIVEFYVSGVQWTIRQNENFQIVDNLNLLKHGANLRYSIKRNMEQYGYYLANANIYHRDKDITCQSFVNNGLLRTQYDDGEILVENASIPASSLPDPLLKADLYKIKVQITFAEAKALILAQQTRNVDETIGGFNRFKDKNGRVRRGFVKDCAWNQVSHTLEATLEEKFDIEGVRIDAVAGGVLINEVGYDAVTLAAVGWYSINGIGYVTIKDATYKDVITPVLFSEVFVGGVQYGNQSDFVDAMNLIL